MSKRAAATFVLAPREKLGAASQYIVVGLSEVTGLIVETDVPDALPAPLVEAGVSIVRA
jgi:DeoR/GlpR family transcriptional regulator of sugar metabolism